MLSKQLQGDSKRIVMLIMLNVFFKKLKSSPPSPLPPPPPPNQRIRGAPRSLGGAPKNKTSLSSPAKGPPSLTINLSSPIFLSALKDQNWSLVFFKKELQLRWDLAFYPEFHRTSPIGWPQKLGPLLFQGFLFNAGAKKNSWNHPM